MDILTVDFETYFDTDYSLKKMTMVEYIMDARFQPIMMSYAINGGEIKNAIGYRQIKDVLDGIAWGNTVLLAQNTKFDGSIIYLRFGKRAAFYVDTMAMARVTGAHVFEGASLDAIAKVLNANGYPVPPKGKEVASAKGKRLYDMYEPMPYLSVAPIHDEAGKVEAHELLMQYVEYCNNDVLLARQAFSYFGGLLNPDEMQYGDMILKCYIIPSMKLHLGIIQDEIVRIRERDHARAKKLADFYFSGDQAALRAVCRSAPKFTEFLKAVGGYLPYEDNTGRTDLYFEIPHKMSEKKGRFEPCYSKSFVPMIEMCEREDWVGDLFRIKRDLTSSIELSRALRFESIAKLGVGFGMPYEVSGAHTHRLGGSGSLNVQNLSSGRKEGQSNALKRSISVSDDKRIIVADSSQIEARTLAYLANDRPYLEVFYKGQDPYSVMASQIYGGDPDEIKRLAKSDVEPYSNIQRPTGKAAVLGCGFSTGPVAFRNFAKLMGVEMSEDDAVRVVGAFREAHQPIVQMWRKCDWVLGQMIAGGSGYFGGPNDNLFYYDGNRINHGKRMPSIRLPDGNWLHYYELCQMPREMPDGSTKLNYAYRGLKEGRIQWIYTYGGRITENLVQAFAFAVMKYQAKLINSRYRIVLNTHDEWGIVVDKNEVENAAAYMQWCMRQVPEWATGLPVDCEGDSAQYYGDCK